MSEAAQTSRINIRVLFFGSARDVVSENPLEISLDSPATVATAFESLAGRFPDLKRFGRALLFAVNQEYATRDDELKDNDEMAVFPPVSGGAQIQDRTNPWKTMDTEDARS